MALLIRKITAADNAAAAAVIRTVMPEFGCVGEGYSIEDPEMDDLYATYTLPRSAYFVAILGDEGAAAGARSGIKEPYKNGKIVACAGFAPLAGAGPEICELRKMYALTEARGLGVGHQLMQACLAGAKANGFTTMYLETVTAMKAAAAFYAKYGFKYIDGHLGATGHSGCDLFMTKSLLD